ncbi:MAG TPA: hypothetical protein VG602_01890 [Actinomycetota bacterium]|nr:hypothetical protein [Actinomycetota bacterium]
MRRLVASTALALATVVAFAAPASAAPDKTGTAAPGAPFKWAGTQATGLNVGYFLIDPVCSHQPQQYCETVLVEFNLPVTNLPPPGATPQTVTADGTGKVGIGSYAPFPLSDFDLVAFASDATGTKGEELDSSGEPAGDPEQVEIPVSSTATVNPDGTVVRNESTWVLLEVVYFAVPQSNYQGTAEIV